MSLMIETPELNQSYLSLSALARKFRPHIPEKITFYSSGESIFDYLLNAAENPRIKELSLALFRTEAETVLQTPGVVIPDAGPILGELPELNKLSPDNFDQQKVTEFDMFLLIHDTQTPMREFQLDMYMKGYKLEPLIKSILVFNHLSFPYELQLDNPDADSKTVEAYTRLMKLTAESVVIPKINRTLTGSPMPIGNYELLELRSAMREFAGLSPLTYAEKFNLLETVSGFIRNRKFTEKHTHQPVNVEITADSAEPEVFMDKGDLYRMLRNLLRDAVTHGKGDEIKPVIKISQSRECALLQIFSPGELGSETLKVIGTRPYTTQERGERLHGYGKVGAQLLLTALLNSLKLPAGKLLANHWQNGSLGGFPHVIWTAPLPYPEV
jgi:hypothetical protein